MHVFHTNFLTGKHDGGLRVSIFPWLGSHTKEQGTIKFRNLCGGPGKLAKNYFHVLFEFQMMQTGKCNHETVYYFTLITGPKKYVTFLNFPIHCPYFLRILKNVSNFDAA